MDKLLNYRRIIKDILLEQASFTANDTEIEDVPVFDEHTDNYILSSLGWHSNNFRQQGYPIHIRIKNEKVWVEWDGTDQEIVRQLVENGIPPEDIVLGFEQNQTLLQSDLIAA